MKDKLRILMAATEEEARRIEENLREAKMNCVMIRVEREDAFSQELTSSTPDLILIDFPLHSLMGSVAPELAKQKMPPVVFLIGTPQEEIALLSLDESWDYVSKTRLSKLIPTINRLIREVEYEAEIRQLRKTLQQNETRFQALISDISDVLMLISPYGTILYAGPSTELVLGHTADTFIGRYIYDVIHPFDVDHIKKNFESMIETPGEAPPKVCFRARHKNGTWMWFEATAKNRISDSSIEAAVVNFHSIPEPH